MKFGLFYEHPLPRPWAEDSEFELIQNALEQCELADRLGIDYVWEVEHHFLEEYSHSSAPEVFLAAVAARTKRIRIAHGIVQTPPGFNHPARIAERISMLDLVSDGRVDFGTGESSSEAELGGFMLDPEQKRAMWEEGTRVALRCMTEEPFTGHSGEFVTMPPRNVVPKPRQKPHPPVWVACSRRDTIHLAATKGIGALAFAFINPEEAKFWVDDYYTTLANECVPIGDVVNPNLACVTTFMCHPDEDVALARGLEGANFFGYSLAHYYVFGEHAPGRTNVWDEFVAQRAEKGYSPEAVEAAREHGDRLGAKVMNESEGGFFGLRGAIGTPDQVRDVPPPLRRGRHRPGDLLQPGGQDPARAHHGDARAVREGDPPRVPGARRRGTRGQSQASRRRARSGAWPASRRPTTRRLPSEDYAFPAIPRGMAERMGSDDFHAWLEDFASKTAVGRGEEIHNMDDLIG